MSDPRPNILGAFAAAPALNALFWHVHDEHRLPIIGPWDVGRLAEIHGRLHELEGEPTHTVAPRPSE